MNHGLFPCFRLCFIRALTSVWSWMMTTPTLTCRPALKSPMVRNGIRKPLRVVTMLAPNLFPVYEFVTRAISKKLGWPAELIVGSTDADPDGSTEICFLCGLLYIQKADLLEPLAAPVLQGERYGGRAIYFSEVIVRADSPFQSFADLRGGSWV